MGAKQMSHDPEQLEDDLQTVLDNVRWGKEANSARNTQKANNHLARAEELLEKYVDGDD
ncbi:MAG: hypothetical protein V5A55_03965 [Halovenus sp.]